MVATAAWAAAGPFALGANALYGAQFTVLAVASFAAAFVLWPRREPGAMGVRLTTWLLVLLGVVYLADAAVVSVGDRAPTAIPTPTSRSPPSTSSSSRP